MIANFIKSIMPSSRCSTDLLRVAMRDGKECPYQPIPINDLKLTHWMRYKINKARFIPAIVDTPIYDKKLAMIVTYRNREQHLQKFPDYLKGFLLKEGIANEILIVEQYDNKPFNRGKLFNIGAMQMFDKCDYFCFHDIDMLPNVASYAYVDHPVLLANSASQFDGEDATQPTVWCRHSSYFGGVILFPKTDFMKINGFSNNYWHWGFEDDDLLMRCLFCGLTPIAYITGRYISLPHKKTVTQTPDGIYHQDNETIVKLNEYYQRNKKRYKKMRRGMLDNSQDGINNLNYKFVKKENYKLYTKISVCL